MNREQPTTNGENGRGANGRFANGNSGGPGNPYARRVAALRSALLEAIEPADVTEIVHRLIEMAKAGDLVAAKEVLARACGKADDADLLDRLSELEQGLRALHELEGRHNRELVRAGACDQQGEER